MLADPNLTLDPKVHSEKMEKTQAAICAVEHFRLGDVLRVVPEQSATTMNETRDASATYRYVEIAGVGSGTYSWTEQRGWELASRAMHTAEEGDIFVGSIWSSVTKWFLAGGDTDNMVVTNGFHRLRLKPGNEDILTDLLAGLCTEAWAVQMRAYARGSDGLAEITPDDLLNIVLPKITDPDARAELDRFVDQLRKGHTSIKAAMESMNHTGRLAVPDVERRYSHVVLV